MLNSSSKKPMNVVRQSCLTARIMATILLLMGSLNAIVALLKNPSDFKNWIIALTAFMTSAGMALVLLSFYDVLCKAGYELTIVVGFALILGAMLLTFLFQVM